MNTEAFHATLSALRDELDTIDRKREKVVHAIQAIEELLAPASAPPVARGRAETKLGRIISKTRGADGVHQDADDPSYPDAVEAILSDVGRPLDIDAIIKRAQARGWYRDHDDLSRFRNSIQGSIARKVREGDTFTRPAPATYGLRAWLETDEQLDIENTPAPDEADTGANPSQER